MMTLVAVFLMAWGCDSDPAPSAEVLAAGDIASCRTEGDKAYPRGTAAKFEECYGPSWGRFKWRTKPVLGNHEYYTEGARGYFDYFGEAAGDPEGGIRQFVVGTGGAAEKRRVPLSVQSPLRLLLWAASQAFGPISPGRDLLGACGDASGSGSGRSPQSGRR
jgi:hypothetical protein